MANKLNTNPTRQELLNLKIKLKTAQRGHKLLKEKRDGLMKNFMSIIREAKYLRTKIEEEMGDSFFSFIFFVSKIDRAIVEESLLVPVKKIDLKAETKNIMGVEVPVFNYKEEGDFLSYDLATTSTSLDRSLIKFSAILKDMVKLAEIEHSAKLLALEIEKTRRRVNALEYVFIPDIVETIKYITVKLNEQERATIITLMKVKEMIAEK
jgi:V/A-type H+/Na+-transporting ATPase subunit D